MITTLEEYTFTRERAAEFAARLDRIADWRRHRAWLEREIAELETPVAAQAREDRAHAS